MRWSALLSVALCLLVAGCFNSSVLGPAGGADGTQDADGGQADSDNGDGSQGQDDVSPPVDDEDQGDPADDGFDGGANDDVDGESADSGDNNDDGGSVQLNRLDPITFFGDVLAGVDPVSYAVAGGSVDFSGGTVATIGVQSLYFNDAFAWHVTAGGTSTITFNGLDVRIVRLYFADLGEPGATLRAISTDEQVLETVESHTALFLGDTLASFEIGGGGASIARLEIESPYGVTVTVDQLVLTVAE
jgi:hypothetical protein